MDVNPSKSILKHFKHMVKCMKSSFQLFLLHRKWITHKYDTNFFLTTEHSFFIKHIANKTKGIILSRSPGVKNYGIIMKKYNLFLFELSLWPEFFGVWISIMQNYSPSSMVPTLSNSNWLIRFAGGRLVIGSNRNFQSEAICWPCYWGDITFLKKCFKILCPMAKWL